MNNIILKTLKFLNRTLSYLNGKVNSLINKRDYTDSIKISEIEYNTHGRFYKFYLTNEHLLEHKEALKGIYTSLMNNEIFRDFGFYKIIIITAIVNSSEYNFHHNVLITNNTSFEEYYDEVKDVINNHYGISKGIYLSRSVPLFKVFVWNMDSYRNKHIKLTKSPVKGKVNLPHSKTLNSFALRQTRGFHSKILKYGFPLVTNKSLIIRFFNNFIKPIKPSNFDSIIKSFEKNYKYKQSFLFAFVFQMLDLKLPENAEPILNYSFAVLTLSVIILFNVSSAFLNLMSLYLLTKYDINEKFKKYPFLIKLIRYYEGGSLINIGIELCMFLFSLSVIIISSAFFLGIHLYYI